MKRQIAAMLLILATAEACPGSDGKPEQACVDGTIISREAKPDNSPGVREGDYIQIRFTDSTCREITQNITLEEDINAGYACEPGIRDDVAARGKNLPRLFPECLNYQGEPGVREPTSGPRS